jgi:hypothetical protein
MIKYTEITENYNLARHCIKDFIEDRFTSRLIKIIKQAVLTLGKLKNG